MSSDRLGRCRAVGCTEALDGQLIDSPDGTGVHLSEWCMSRVPLGTLGTLGNVTAGLNVDGIAGALAAIGAAFPASAVVPFRFSSPNMPAVDEQPALCCGGWVGPGGVRMLCTECPESTPQMDERQGFVFSAPHVVDDGVPDPFCAGCAYGMHFCVSCGVAVEHGSDDWCDTHRPAELRRYVPHLPPDPVAAFLSDVHNADVPLTTADEELRLPVGTVTVTPAFAAPRQLRKGSVLSTDQARIRQQLINMVKDYSAADPRSLQVEIGPSEIGDPCGARIMRTVLGMPKINDSDPWASFVGTATHARLGLAAEWANEAAERAGAEPPYIVERRVYLTDGIGGNTDLYSSGDIVDHKVIGTDSMKGFEAHGWDANPKYGIQLDLYGKGWANAGHEVRTVSLALWPRSGFLDGLLVLTRPWDPANAERAMERLSTLTEVAVLGELDEHDEPWQTVETVPGKGCGFCPFYAPNQPKTRFACPDGRDYQSDKKAGRGPRKGMP